jgi:hypothetical protein
MIPESHPNLVSVTVPTRLSHDRNKYFPTSASSPDIITSLNVHSVVPPKRLNHNPPPFPPEGRGGFGEQSEIVVFVMEIVLLGRAVRDRAPPDRLLVARHDEMEVLSRETD